MEVTKRRRLSAKERKQIYDKYNGHCAYCGTEITFRGMQADHIYPLRLGGADTIENLVPACRSCNHYKDTFTLDKFREHLQGIPARIRRDDIAYQVGERFGIVGETGKQVRFYFEEDSHETD